MPAGNGGSPRRIFTTSQRAADPAASVLGQTYEEALEAATFQDQDKIRRSLAGTNDYNEYDYLRNVRMPTARSSATGLFAQQQAIYFAGDLGEQSLEEFQQNLRDAGVPEYLIREQIVAGAYYNRSAADMTEEYFDTNYRVKIALGDIEAPQAPSALSDVPTSSSNFKRPRTVAAGWDPDTNVLTVVFRDGTWWNYYNVTHEEWIKFHFAFSKGPMLNKAGKVQSQDGFLLLSPHSNGPADQTKLSDEVRYQLYKAARTAQIMYREGKPRINPSTGVAYGVNPLTGKGKPTRGTAGSQNRGGLRRRGSLGSTKAPVNPNANKGKNPNQK